MTYAMISGTGTALPKKILTNQDLAQLVDTTDEWIYSRTGIKQRHVISQDETLVSLSVGAAKEALAMAQLTASDLDMIIVATTTPDNLIPNTACSIQAALAVGDCIAFDITVACAGFVYALGIADQFIRNGAVHHVLIVGADCLSRVVDWHDRTTCVLFGDGAGAMILSAAKAPGIESVHLHADGNLQHILNLPFPHFKAKGLTSIQMKGNDVFKYAVTHLQDSVTEALEANELSHGDIDWLVPHQANIRIIQSVAKRLHLSMDRVILTIEKHGNTSAASIPLALDEALRQGTIKKGERMLLEAFGGGLVWGAAVIVY